MIEGTGIHQEISSDIVNKDPWKDQPHGVHLWSIVVAYRIVEPRKLQWEQIYLDKENVVSVSSVGCLICEAVWSERVDKSFCRGEPK